MTDRPATVQGRAADFDDDIAVPDLLLLPLIEVAADVLKLVQDFLDKGVMTL